jgi:hypothetical protein
MVAPPCIELKIVEVAKTADDGAPLRAELPREYQKFWTTPL